MPFRTLTYCEGIHYGSESDWQMVLELFEREAVQVERERFNDSIGLFQGYSYIEKAFGNGRRY